MSGFYLPTIRFGVCSFAVVAIVLGLGSARETNADDQGGFLVAGMRVLPKRWDKDHNFALLKRYAKAAARHGADLVVTCEGFLDGYSSNASHSPGLTFKRLFEAAETIMARDSGTGDELVYARIELDERVGTGDILQRRPPEVYRELLKRRALDKTP